MAVRRTVNPKGQEAIRRRIQGTVLAKRLQDDALGKIELTDGQRESAKFLLTRAISPPVPKDDDGKTATGPVLITWGT